MILVLTKSPSHPNTPYPDSWPHSHHPAQPTPSPYPKLPPLYQVSHIPCCVAKSSRNFKLTVGVVEVSMKSLASILTLLALTIQAEQTLAGNLSIYTYDVLSFIRY